MEDDYRLMSYFENYDRSIQRVVKRVIDKEIEHIDSKRPRVKEYIRKIIDKEVSENET